MVSDLRLKPRVCYEQSDIIGEDTGPTSVTVTSCGAAFDVRGVRLWNLRRVFEYRPSARFMIDYYERSRFHRTGLKVVLFPLKFSE